MASGTLHDILHQFENMPEEMQAEVARAALENSQGMVWVPNPGPQTEAYYSEADELFYGGSAGGGKSDLIIGLSLNEHRKSLILREFSGDARALGERTLEIVGSREGWNGQLVQYRLGDVHIDYDGCQYETDKQKFKGKPHDLIGFDEIGDFLESQYDFIKAWNRSTVEGQRCRVVATGNPPTEAKGLWVIRKWGPWLDKNHPNPAESGELRYYTTGEDGKEKWVDGPGPHLVNGEEVMATSRTFIRAKLEDNPDLEASGYDKTLAALRGDYREAYRDGVFKAELAEGHRQLIPTAWIKAAQDRWTPDGWMDYVMTSIAIDPAGGGNDAEEIVARFGGWFSEFTTTQNSDTADGDSAAIRLLMIRKHAAPIIIDMGGGYGGAIALRLKDNDIKPVPYNGANATAARSKCGNYTFVNKRAEAYWRLMEELDPNQEGGSVVCLPPGDELLTDLTSVTWSLKRGGVLIGDKDAARKLLGRSTGKGDVIAMALSEGNAALKRDVYRNQGKNRPKVVRGHKHMKRR